MDTPDTHLEHLKAITTLRSDKKIDKTIHPKTTQIEVKKSSTVSFENLESSSNEQECVSWREEEDNVPCTIPAPFPQRHWAPKKGTNNDKIYKIFEQIKINIPFVDAIKQIPTYANFLKRLVHSQTHNASSEKYIFYGASKFHYSNQDNPKV